MTILLSVTSLAVVAILVERFAGARAWPRVASWWPRALLLNAVQFGIAWIAGQTWELWWSEYRLWQIEGIGTTAQAWIGYVAITFIYYWWHRWRHSVPFLWRWLHQVHHSPARIEIITSFYKHPIEILFNSWLSTAILYFLVGVNPEAAALAVLITGVAELFYHWNIKTPYWVGFVLQRPESHCVHHQCGLHAYNYADLPIWDMLFGTFRNPKDWREQCGFEDDAEQKLGAMLCGREVI